MPDYKEPTDAHIANLQKEFLGLFKGYEKASGPMPCKAVDAAFKANPELATVMLPNNIRPIEMALNSKNFWISQKIAVLAQIKANPEPEKVNENAIDNFGTILAKIKASFPNSPEWAVRNQAENLYLATFTKESKKNTTPELVMYVKQMELEHWYSEENKKDFLLNAYNDKVEAAQNNNTEIPYKENPLIDSPELCIPSFLLRAILKNKPEIVEAIVEERVRADKVAQGKNFDAQKSTSNAISAEEVIITTNTGEIPGEWPGAFLDIKTNALMLAVCTNNDPMVEKLMKLKADTTQSVTIVPENPTNPHAAFSSYYRTSPPAHYCAVNGKLSTLKILKHYAGDAPDIKSDYGHTPFEAAIFIGNKDIINYYIELYKKSPKPELFQQYMNDGLRHAVTPDIATYLLDTGAQVNGHSPQTGFTPLHCIGNYGIYALNPIKSEGIKIDYEGVYKVLMKRGADANLRDNNNCLPLHHAFSTYMVPTSIIKDLIDKTTDFTIRDKRENNNDRTLFHAAVKHDDAEFVKRILAKDPKQAKMLASLVDDKGCTALHYAVKESNFKTVAALLPYSDLNCQDKSGKVPLHYAVSKMEYNGYISSYYEIYLDIIQMVRTDANVAIKNHDGQTPADILDGFINRQLEQEKARPFNPTPDLSEAKEMFMEMMQKMHLLEGRSILKTPSSSPPTRIITLNTDILKKALDAGRAAAGVGASLLPEDPKPMELLPTPRESPLPQIQLIPNKQRR